MRKATGSSVLSRRSGPRAAGRPARAGVVAVALAVLAGLSPVPATAAEPDVTGPRLVSLSVLTPTVDTTGGGGRATLGVGATDDAAGVWIASVTLTHAPTGQTVNAGGSLRVDGVLATTVEASGDVPRYAANGTWRVTSVWLEDRNSNRRTYDVTALADASLSAQVEITGPQDITPPTVFDHSVTPSELDLDKEDPYRDDLHVEQSVGGEDDLSGLSYIQPYWRSPSGQERPGFTDFYPQGGLREYVGFDVTFSRDDEVGTWTLDRIVLGDQAGNEATVTGAQVAAQGLPTTLSLFRGSDPVPPTLVDAATTPTTLDTTTGPVTAEVRVRVYDEGSAPDADSVSGTFRGPDGSVVATTFSTTEGTPSDLTSVLTAVFPQGSADGNWVVETLRFSDRAGNEVVLDRDEIVRRNLPVDAVVTSEEFLLPGSPPKTRAHAGDGSVVVTWEPPADTGSGPITLYTVVVSDERTGRPVVFRVSPATRSITATGLSNDVEYYVSVAAHNRFGPGVATYLSGIFPGPGPVPTDVRATPGTGSALVSWRRPRPDSSGRVIGYEVAVVRSGLLVNPVRFASTATRQRITGLDNDERYAFVVRAITAAGTGRRSEPSAPVVPRATPDAPTAVRAQAGSGSALLLWRRPVFTGQGHVTGYEITTTQTIGGPVFVVRVPAHPTWRRMTGLTHGLPYRFSVRAINSAGSGPSSDLSSWVTPTR